MLLLTVMNICLTGDFSLSIGAILVLFVPPLVTLLLLLFFLRLRSQHRELNEEIELFGKLVPENVELDMVLKVMSLSLWRINASTRTIVYDYDYRQNAVDRVAPGQEKSIDDVYAMLAPWDRDRVVKEIENLLQGISSEAHLIYQMRELYADRYHWMETSATVMSCDADGKPNMVVGTSTCIDLRKEMEKELLVARNRAEESDRIKSAFLANMSHEIRTPLNSIVGFSSLMATAQTNADRKRFASIIKENADILLRLINDVLDIAKIEAGTLEYVRRPINLRKVWFSIFDTYCNRVPQGVELKLEVPPTELIISEDRSRLLQVIGNLVTNAIKFTHQGSITVGYTMEKQCAHCFVKDTGVGIAAEKIEQIFDRFVKLNIFAQGTGLGLSICKMLVQKWDGKIWVESEVGKGSTFHFTIPLHR